VQTKLVNEEANFQDTFITGNDGLFTTDAAVVVSVRTLPLTHTYLTKISWCTNLLSVTSAKNTAAV